MDANSVLMAYAVPQNMQVTVEGQHVFVVPGDHLLDSPDGSRQLLHQIQYRAFVETHGYSESGDRGFGWIELRK